jgi:hypothetical protein
MDYEDVIKQIANDELMQNFDENLQNSKIFGLLFFKYM